IGGPTSVAPASLSGAPPPTMLAAGSTMLPPAIPAAAVVLPATAPPGSSPAASSPLLQMQQQPAPGEVRQFRTNPMARLASPSISGGPHYLPADVIELSAGSSHIIDFARRLKRVSIADSDVADVQVISPYEINLIGHKEGFTTLTIWDSHGHYEERQVRIDPYGKQQVMLNVIVAELDRSRLEQQGVNFSIAMPNQGISLVGLPGQVATPYNPQVTLTPSTVLGAGSSTQTVVNQTASGALPAAGTLIPLLLSSTINYGIAAGNSNFQTQFFFQALENHNFAKILAEPRLLANSGEKAEFLSGGEIPIVVAQALNTSIVFKKFGTSVIFVPTVIGSDQIALEVMPEVSQPDYAHSVQLFGFSVPAFVTRTAHTSVRLRNDQTLIIAGLILHTKTSQLQKTPYLGDIPYVGALFRTTSYQDQENDLVMTVTPEIVAPIPVNGVAAYPTDRGPLSPSDTATQPIYPQDVSRPRF
ncbi:MAG TPA: pilus assembly protein N-terminal domain-containing protein, partial [Candidatus Binataceae bacterium]|nr:pilus assembly protein N-terminal domain-containing protein [Candidatus Binataceae bacterium]